MTSDDLEIYRLFHGRCVHCGEKAGAIHEIEPRSVCFDAMDRDNRVPLCRNCHDWAHLVGVRKSIPILQSDRQEALARYGSN